MVGNVVGDQGAAASAIDEGQPRASGLQLRFAAGEKIPWKGIWFTIEMVTPQGILLKPEGETWAHHKKRTGRE